MATRQHERTRSNEKQMKRVTVYDYGDYYWIFTIDGVNNTGDMAETAEEASHIVRRRLLTKLSPSNEYWEEQ